MRDDPDARPAAPIDRAAVERTLAPFGTSRTLPREAFHSRDLFEWELNRFFADSWVNVGRVGDVETGALTAVRSGHQGVVLARDEHGTLRGFSNVCRHRGHELVQDPSTAPTRTIQCPYHGWTYGLDGTLRGAPSFGGTPGFDRDEFSLVELPVAEWHGWVFVTADHAAGDFAGHAGNLDDLIAPYRPERLLLGASTEYEVAANWKLIVENYHECYHCTNIHPELCRVTPPDSGVDHVSTGLWVGGRMDLMEHASTMSLTGESGGRMLPGLTLEQLRTVEYAGLFPNLLISAHPDYVLTHRLEPLAPGLTRVTCQWLFDPDAVSEAGFDPPYAVDFWDLTNRQDWRACEAVQRGTGNVGYRPGPLSARESTVYQFLSIVARAYLDGVLAPPVFVARPEGRYQDSEPGSPLNGPTMSSVTQPP